MQRPGQTQDDLASKVVTSSEAQEISYLLEISQACQFITSLPLENELDVCAFEYGLVKIGTLASELLEKNKHKTVLAKFSEDYHVDNLNDILAGFIQVRNCLADGFHRLRPNEHERLIALKNNAIILWFCNPARLAAPFDKTALGAIQAFEAFNKMLQKERGNSVLNNIGCMVFYLTKIANFCMPQNALQNERVLYAVSMLFIAVGTCSREGRSKSEALPKALAPYKEIRDLLAHLYCFARKGDAWQQVLSNTLKVIDKRILKLNRLIEQGESQLHATCKKPERLNDRPIYQALASSTTLSSTAHLLQALPEVPAVIKPAASVNVDAFYDEYMAQIGGFINPSASKPTAVAMPPANQSADTTGSKRAIEKKEEKAAKVQRPDEGDTGSEKGTGPSLGKS